MQITVGAKCWDGDRRKSLASSDMRVEVLAQLPQIDNRVRFDPKLKALMSFAIPVLFLTSGFPPFGLTHAIASSVPGMGAAIPAMAMSVDTKAKIMHAFDPLINLVQSLAYPIAGIMIAGGCLMIMVQQREQGMKMLQNAAIGYILVQLSPMLLQLLVGIGSGL